MKRFLAILACIAMVHSVRAGRITVGADGGDYATIAAGAAAAQPGDTVEVQDGTYNERVTLSASGTVGNRIVIKAASRHGVSMKGFDVQADYVTIDGFEITGISDLHAIKNGTEGGSNLGRTHTHIINNYIHDISYPSKWAVHSGRYGYVAGNLLKRVNAGIYARSNTLVENNRILDLNPGKPIHVFFLGDSITMRNNYLWDTNSSIGNNGGHFFTTWDAGNGIQSHDILIENNTGFSTTHASEPVCGASGRCARFTYRNNLFVNTYFVGIMTKYVDDVSIYNNTLINCGSYPVWLANTGGSNLVKNNLMAYWGPVDSIIMGNGIDKHIRVEASSTMPDVDYNYVWRYSNEVSGSHDGAFHPLTTFVNPEPFDTALADFRLKAGATVINAGCDMGITYDNDGNARPSGSGFDIGAYEYQEGSAVHGTDQAIGETGIRVRPLAVGGMLTVRADRALGQLQVTDTNGRIVWQGATGNSSISVDLTRAGLYPGRYFVTAGPDAGVQTFLLID